jgi:hypothetical protein
MKYIFLISILLGGNFVKLFAQHDTSYPLTLNIAIEKEYNQKFSKRSFAYDIERGLYNIKKDSVTQKQYDIKVEIKNNSEKSVFIWLMSCSWEDNFEINNNYISLKGHSCDKNIPHLIEIKKGESKIYKTTLSKSIKFDYPCENCIYGKQVETSKLGLIIIDDIFKPKSEGFGEYSLAMEDKSLWKRIWSNPLYLLTENELNPKPMEIPVIQNSEKKKRKKY